MFTANEKSLLIALKGNPFSQHAKAALSAFSSEAAALEGRGMIEIFVSIGAVLTAQGIEALRSEG